MRQAGEPSVEEILESIKKVIARDNRSDAAAERRVRESRGVTPPAAEDRDDEILDLATSGEFVDELDEGHEDEGAFADDATDQPESPLITEVARSSMRDSLAALAMLSEPGAQPQIVRSGETSLEGLTRELLRPALAEWLDKNLPPLVERLVATEIARIVGKKG
jgi:cell pole-organizing protein PopZ